MPPEPMESATAKATIVTIAKNLTYFSAIFISLNPESYGILGFLMLVDTITGVIRSGIVHGWRSVTSHMLTVGVLAKCTLILVPLLIALAGHGVGLNLAFVAKSALNILILAELYSTLSNIQAIRLRKDIPEFDAVNYTLLKLRELLERTVKKPDQI